MMQIKAFKVILGLRINIRGAKIIKIEIIKVLLISLSDEWSLIAR